MKRIALMVAVLIGIGLYSHAPEVPTMVPVMDRFDKVMEDIK